MAVMHKLKFPPDQLNYQINWGNTVVQTNVAGGPPRTRADVVGAPYAATVQWTCTDLTKYDALQAFYRYTTQRGALPFLIDLQIESVELEEYTCVVQQNTWNIVSTDGNSWVVGCVLIVNQNPNDNDTDLQLVATIVDDSSVNQ